MVLVHVPLTKLPVFSHKNSFYVLALASPRKMGKMYITSIMKFQLTVYLRLKERTKLESAGNIILKVLLLFMLHV